MSCAEAPAGLDMGPRILNTVRTPRARRMGMTAAMAGLVRGGGKEGEAVGAEGFGGGVRGVVDGDAEGFEDVG